MEKYFERKRITAPTLAQTRDAVVAIRTGKLPDIKKVGTAGSFLCIRLCLKSRLKNSKARFPDLSFVPYTEGAVKIIAGRLLDTLGWKGVREGNVGTHATHALAIINYGTHNAQEIYNFASRMKKDAKEKTGVEIELKCALSGIFRNVTRLFLPSTQYTFMRIH